MRKQIDLSNLSPEELKMFAKVQEFARERSAGVNPRMQKAALASVIGASGIAAGGALVDQFVGEDNALNSGEFFLNAPIAAMPVVGAGLGAVAGTRMVGPEQRERVKNAEVAQAKEGLQKYARDNSYDAAQQRFADQKNAAINKGIHLRNQRAYGGAALGAVLGAAGSLALMRDGSAQPMPPSAQESIAASISMKDRNEMIALLDAHGAL